MAVRGHRVRSRKKTVMAGRSLAAVAAVLLAMAGAGGCAGSSEDAARMGNYVVDEEQKLIVYTSHKEEGYGPIIKEFETAWSLLLFDRKSGKCISAGSLIIS